MANERLRQLPVVREGNIQVKEIADGSSESFTVVAGNVYQITSDSDSAQHRFYITLDGTAPTLLTPDGNFIWGSIWDPPLRILALEGQTALRIMNDDSGGTSARLVTVTKLT